MTERKSAPGLPGAATSLAPAARALEGEMSRPVFGARPSKFGQKYGTLLIESGQQVDLLLSVLEDGMRKHAGRHEVTLLAELSDSLAKMKERAAREGWIGWET